MDGRYLVHLTLLSFSYSHLKSNVRMFVRLKSFDGGLNRPAGRGDR
jgi:hypothetical protein